ncbi:MAG: hypothetical protein M3Z03_16830 [Actinomycetota bacterium]|nr:hypothetical protein [Actinomycetota bacterium]
MAEISIGLAEIEALGAKLDALDDVLSATERGLLVALFRMAGQAAAAESSEVVGFAADQRLGTLVMQEPAPKLSSGFVDSFKAGTAVPTPGVDKFFLIRSR